MGYSTSAACSLFLSSEVLKKNGGSSQTSTLGKVGADMRS